jgi:lysozyme family protein
MGSISTRQPYHSAYSQAFLCAVNFVFSKEGRYHRNAKDLGGETHFGISSKAYPKEDILHLTQERAQFLYHRDYWRATYCREWPAPVALLVFDGAVQHGQITAIRLLQECVGTKADGLVGPVTRHAVFNANPLWLSARYCLRRARLYNRIQIKNPSQVTFIEGWFNRLRDGLDTAFKVAV